MISGTPEKFIAQQSTDALVRSICMFSIRINAEFQGEDQQRIMSALNLMTYLHDGQFREEGRLYASHPLTVATEICDAMEHKDSDLVIASLLHDSIEDQAEKLAKLGEDSYDLQNQRAQALKYIANFYGLRVMRILDLISNPDFSDQLAKEDLQPNQVEFIARKNELYAQHVQEAIEDPDVLLIKYFDFSDNFFKLSEVPDETRRISWLRKYAPLIAIFLDRLNGDIEGRINISEADKHKIVEKLKNAQLELDGASKTP